MKNDKKFLRKVVNRQTNRQTLCKRTSLAEAITVRCCMIVGPSS